MIRLLEDVEVLESLGDPSTAEVSGVAHDSRRVVPGDLFCCVPGLVSDGHVHAAEAVERGAVGLLCEHFVPEVFEQDVAQVRIAPGTMRPAMARVAARFYDFPARDLLMIGVTGTNGKTTVTQLLGDLFAATGRPASVMGTLSGTRTTPEATEVQQALASIRDRQESEGRRHAVAMEVSSHALVHSRVDALRFDVAVFINLSHDHLDYHHTMEDYFEAKASLFTPDHASRAVVNADDPWGRRLIERARIPMTEVHHADASDISLEAGCTRFTWRGQRIATPLTGSINVDNTLLAAETGIALELEPEEIAGALTQVSPVPGRLQVIAAPAAPGDGPPFTVLVDYAHTPAALAGALAEAKTLARRGGQVICVFGCGGNRDRTKRPLMGKVAQELSDVTYLTSDNPRDEDPLAIIDEILTGVDRKGGSSPIVVEPDRGTAIRRALDAARAGDVVVLAGKGHEAYQEMAGQRFVFDDVVQARQALASRFGSDPDSWVPCRATGGSPSGN